MTHSAVEKMLSFKLPGMAEEFQRQLADPSSSDLTFEQRVGCMLDFEETVRNNKRLQILMKRAKLSKSACVEDIWYHVSRSMDKATMKALTTLDWVKLGHNLVLAGPTGTGKTWLACALGNQACRTGMKTNFLKVPALLELLVAAHATNTFQHRLAQLKTIDLLIIDEWGMDKYSQREQLDLLEVLDARLGAKSTVITSQIPMEKWHDALDNKVVADAIMDRVVNSSYYMRLTGKSLRELDPITGKPRKK